MSTLSMTQLVNRMLSLLQNTFLLPRVGLKGLSFKTRRRYRRGALCCLALWGWTFPICALAVNPGEQVVVVYNTRLPASQALAEYYAQKRLVPTNQIFGFALTTNEAI